MPQAHGASTLCGITSSRTRRLLRDETGVAAVPVPPVLVVGIAEPTFVVTLATALLFRGIGLALADGGQISGMPQDHAVFRVVGAFLLVEHTLPHLGAGACVSIDSSVAGFTADPGIRVNTLHPGPRHPVHAAHRDRLHRAAFPARGQGVRRDDPLGRHAAPQKIARTVLHLAGDDASSTTGATVAVDGGMSVREASPS
ncbi:SDR family oxidoreductase [Actinacidiphila glaucinigra]|uniref:SDR family oxidoreductase n=1 Tax=Actinacidiphila glaucinigra TaxID=235986 RepID=UPI00371FD13B